jgi:uncharacterized membrane protein HdeD (DUF308 family)
LLHCLGYNILISVLSTGGKDEMPVITVPVLGLWMGIASLVFGVIVMIFPKILNYLLGVYLIIIGIMAIIAYFNA